MKRIILITLIFGIALSCNEESQPEADILDVQKLTNLVFKDLDLIAQELRIREKTLVISVKSKEFHLLF